MKVIKIIQNEIALAHPEMHKTRLNTLFTFVHSGLKDQRLTVTYLGRGLKGLSKTDKKHDIKCADRLCGNTYLHSECIDFYKYMAESLIVNERHPLLIVDWSPINGSEIFQLLRVSIPMGGRALTIYEKTYEKSELNTRTAHQALLNAIKYCLPDGCRPIILADAIFKTPWLLISCLPQKWDINPKKVMKLYATRMQIEEAFRDTKNAILGISLEFANSRTPERFDMLLLIGALILYILWCIGFVAEQLNFHRSLQANTVKNRRVLSHIYLGREVIDDERYTIYDEFVIWVLHELPNLIIRLGNL